MWACDCGRENAESWKGCPECGELRPGGLSGYDRYLAGARRLAERYGLPAVPEVVGGRATYDRMTRDEIDEELAQLAVSIMRGIVDEARDLGAL
jgi:hypothetical protein